MLTKWIKEFLHKEIDKVDFAALVIEIGQETLTNFDSEAFIDRVWTTLGPQIEPELEKIYDAIGNKLSE